MECGYQHVLALTEDGNFYSWGADTNGELGQGTKGGFNPVPNLVQFPEPKSKISKIFAQLISAALTKDGNLYVWGWNDLFSLGLGDSNFRSTPQLVLHNVANVALGGGHALALLRDGTLLGWGANPNGELGFACPDKPETPQPSLISKFFEDRNERIACLGCGFEHSFLVTQKGNLYTWGKNKGGQFGNGITQNSPIPFKFPIRVKIPVDAEWEFFFRWLFLGYGDDTSIFFRLPIEIIFNIVHLRDPADMSVITTKTRRRKGGTGARPRGRNFKGRSEREWKRWREERGEREGSERGGGGRDGNGKRPSVEVNFFTSFFLRK
jgi:hypothetical protein